jgi:REP-associated tyrosine transposase
MARRPRIHYPGALYHVISRGNQRQKVFKDAPDYRHFETLLGETVKSHRLTAYAYVLMPNHFHLLLEVSRSPLSRAMQSLLYRYTRYYNQRYHKIGHLFQGRYKAILCDPKSKSSSTWATTDLSRSSIERLTIKTRRGPSE